eukprot:3384876-Alexandrium_andersonii.AAC.1
MRAFRCKCGRMLDARTIPPSPTVHEAHLRIIARVCGRVSGIFRSALQAARGEQLVPGCVPSG